MRPATAPVRTRLVGAALRTAAMMTAKGTIAMMGIERRHSSHSSPITILLQCELGASPRLIAASSTIAANGIAAEIDEVLRSPPSPPAQKSNRRISPRRHLVEFRQRWIDGVPGVTAHAVHHL